jgi:uncharacterized membrane protein YdjX (TVP38/TMEM64 family)
MKTYDECLDQWIGILLGCVFIIIVVTFLAAIYIGTNGWGLLIIVALSCVVWLPPYLCFLWNNRKKRN